MIACIKYVKDMLYVKTKSKKKFKIKPLLIRKRAFYKKLAWGLLYFSGELQHQEILQETCGAVT